MTDHNQEAPVKRLHYFDQQFLREPDFTAEQAYHMRMRRLHNRAFHTWGIAEGLQLEGKGTSHVTVTPGIAIDRLGQEMVLTERTPTNDLSEYRDKTVYITIAYNEEQTDPTSETGVERNTRWTEEPDIRPTPDPPADEEDGIRLILGRVRLNGVGQVEDIDDGEGEGRRRETGVRAGDLQAQSATVTGDVAVGGNLSVTGSSDLQGDTRIRAPLTIDPGVATTLGGDLHVRGAATIDSGLSVSGDIGVSGTVAGRDVGSDGTRLDQHLNDRENPHSITAAQAGALALTGGTIMGDLSVNGNVGIGTAEPHAKLHVSGDIALGNTAGGGQKLFLTSAQHTHYIQANSWWTEFVSHPNEGWKFISKDNQNAIERVRISSSGNVGIGTTDPHARMHIDGGALRIGGSTIQELTGTVRQPGDFIELSIESPSNTSTYRANFLISAQELEFSSPNIGQVMTLFFGGNTGSTGRVNVNGTLSATTISSSRGKTFRITHPLRTGYDLVHACLEGPETGVYYRGTARLQDGQATVQLPDYFEALTRPDDRTVQLTAIGAEPFLLSYTPIQQGEFIVYGTHPEGMFAWEVTAVRADVPPLEVEAEQED